MSETHTEKVKLLNLIGEDKVTKTEAIEMMNGFLGTLAKVKEDLIDYVDRFKDKSSADHKKLSNLLETKFGQLEARVAAINKATAASQKTWESLYNRLSFDVEQLKATEPEDYQPQFSLVESRLTKLETVEQPEPPVITIRDIEGLREELDDLRATRGRAIGGGLAKGVADRLYAPIGSTGSADSGSGAPNTTPSSIGSMYIDTGSSNIYIATGTSSSADWKLMASFS